MSWAIWIAGRPGSGASALARATAARLAALGSRAAVLELDRLRPLLTPAPVHSACERDVVHRALVFMAAALTEAGVPVLIDAAGHRRAWRELARATIPRFAEVRLEAPADDTRGRPADAARPGTELPWEDAASPELVIEAGTDVGAAAERVAALGRALAVSPPLPARGGAVIWLTGLPGSGKTTLASCLADALAGEGVPVRMLEWTALHAFVLDGAAGSALEQDVAHRALACTATLLAEEGFTVVVDATAPRRAWRTLARQIAPAFAEVQLVCPAEVCLGRERAVRWGRLAGDRARGATPDIVVEYEYSLSPDLLLDTAARSEWAAREDLVRLARRLLRRPAPERSHAMHVRDLMSDKPITVDPATPMLDARQRMTEARIRHLIVTEGSRVVGIVTDRDIRLNLPSPATTLSVWEMNALLAKLTVGEVMTRSVITIGADRPAAEAARIMVDHKIGALPVMEGRTLVGIVTESDFVRAAARANAGT